MTTDYLIYDHNMLLTRNRAKDWKQQINDRGAVVLRFYKEHGLLVNCEPFDDEGNIKSDLIIRESNLTEDGDKLWFTGVENWRKYMDRGGDINNISRLMNALKRIRKNKI